VFPFVKIDFMPAAAEQAAVFFAKLYNSAWRCG
jgi:hypothetical protein